jgi:hypothetical protein
MDKNEFPLDGPAAGVIPETQTQIFFRSRRIHKDTDGDQILSREYPRDEMGPAKAEFERVTGIFPKEIRIFKSVKNRFLQIQQKRNIRNIQKPDGQV